MSLTISGRAACQHNGIKKLLAQPISDLLISGGDERLRIDQNNMLNKYGCKATSQPKAISFAFLISFTLKLGSLLKVVEDFVLRPHPHRLQKGTRGPHHDCHGRHQLASGNDRR